MVSINEFGFIITPDKFIRLNVNFIDENVKIPFFID
jgi:hypothetical protein